MNKLSYLYEFYVETSAVTLLLALMSAFKYIQINSHIKFLKHTFMKAGRNLLWYVALVSCMVMGFASMGHFAFGNSSI